ncbi:hypothetical protein ACO0M4_29935 [Streptomyces sp. RGM 3693]|uniref:hypothetical protein n=1 Tax=Streptomyces sp. RGM 3693 TaxID=3413284 RepID=UPI003D289D55
MNTNDWRTDLGAEETTTDRQRTQQRMDDGTHQNMERRADEGTHWPDHRRRAG